jgi:orotate phosphoribosyltransferase
MSLTEGDVLRELERCDALLTGHFLLSSGLHSGRYVQCALLFSDPARAERIGKALAKKAPSSVELVVSPAMGGVLIGHEVARALGVPHFFAERVDGKMALRRGFALRKADNVLIVEDVFTTGKSTQETVDLVTSLGGNVLAALSVVRRSEGPLAVSVPYDSLLQLKIDSFDPKVCPQCKEGVPAVKPGSRPQPKGTHV